MPKRWCVFAWIDQDQAALLRDVVALAGVELIAVGCTDATAARDLASELECAAVDDLRHGLEQYGSNADLVWLASRQAIDQSLHAVIARIGTSVLTNEPRPDSTAAVLKDPAFGELFTCAPLMALSEGACAGRAVLAECEPAHCLSIHMSCGDAVGSLRARLFDALHVSSWLCGEAVEINAASYVGDNGRQWLTANVTFEVGRTAAITVHSGGGPWSRQVIVHGADGFVVMTDTTCRWFDSAVQQISEPAAATNFGAQIAAQIRRMPSRRDQLDQPVEIVRVLALCDAALLSCRTRQVETPGRMLQALAGP